MPPEEWSFPSAWIKNNSDSFPIHKNSPKLKFDCCKYQSFAKILNFVNWKIKIVENGLKMATPGTKFKTDSLAYEKSNLSKHKLIMTNIREIIFGKVIIIATLEKLF